MVSYNVKMYHYHHYKSLFTFMIKSNEFLESDKRNTPGLLCVLRILISLSDGRKINSVYTLEYKLRVFFHSLVNLGQLCDEPIGEKHVIIISYPLRKYLMRLLQLLNY